MISIIFPFRSDGGPRDRIFDWILLRWHALFPDAEIRIGDNEGSFNRGLSRNLAVQDSQGDVLVIVDADTAINRGQIEVGLEMVRSGVSWVLPYTTYFNLNADTTELLLRKPHTIELPEPIEWDHRLTESVAGVLIVPREAYELVGGYDTRFQGWGGEDRAFAHALDVMCGPHGQVEGNIQHFWHPRGLDFDGPEWSQNQRLLRQYQKARDRLMMRMVLEGS